MKRYVPYVLAAVLIGLILWIAFGQPFQAFDRYYFAPAGEPAWKGAVWGNVIAIPVSIPIIVILGVIGYYFHKRAMAPLHEKIDRMAVAHAEQAATHDAHHEEHMRAVKSILDALDPGTESESILDTIADRVDDRTDSGIGAILKRLGVRS